MPALRDNALVIRRWDYSETSMTVSLFTCEHGVIRGIAKGAKREKGAFSGGLDLLTAGEVVALVKPGRELNTLTAWTLTETFPHLRRSLRANRVAIYMCDLIHHLLRDHEPAPALFDAALAALHQLRDHNNADFILLAFQWNLLVECGFAPVLDRDARTGTPLERDCDTLAFSARAGGVVADTGGNDRWRVRPSTIDMLRQVAQRALPADAGSPSSAPEVIGRANRLLAAYICEILGQQPDAMMWALPDLRADPAPPT
jgi:DNA repair protein RecO (recombination protein O)